MKYIIHSNSVCHVTHLLEIEAETPDDALEAYREGQPWDLIGVQIGDNVEFVDSDPDEAHDTIRGVYIPYPDPIPANPWAEDTTHPVEDWQFEVANDDTRLGYWEWVKAQETEV